MVEIRLADYNDPNDAQILVQLLSEYARDPMGGGKDLAQQTKDNLAQSMAKIPHAYTVFAFVDGEPAGLINCFEAFSTFKCRPLVNIHDVSVSPNFRGLGLSTKMMELVENEAKSRNACKLTLEVLEGNSVAQSSYENFGFSGYELDPEMGKAMFWEKPLN